MAGAANNRTKAATRGEPRRAQANGASGRAGRQATAPKGAQNDRRWQEVLDAATAVFYEKGYQAATLQDVASRVRLLAPSLYYYINTKEDLLFAVLERAHRIAMEQIVEPPSLAAASAEVRLAAFIRRWMKGTYPPEGRILDRDLRFLSTKRRTEVISWRDRLDHFVRDIVRQGIEEGTFDPSVEPSVAASTVFVVLNSTPAWWKPSGPLSYEDLAEWYVSLFLKGLTASGREVQDLTSIR
jgi:AcrR family transcriptional regulator